MIHSLITVQKDVEVDIARSLVNYFGPAHILFDGLKLIQQLQRCQISFYLGCTINPVIPNLVRLKGIIV